MEPGGAENEENSLMKLSTHQIDVALLLVNFAPEELMRLSDQEQCYLASMTDEEDLPAEREPRGCEEAGAPDLWKERFITLLQRYADTVA